MQRRGATKEIRPPQQTRSQDSTNRALDATLEILDRDGMAGLTLSAVSRESGVSNGAIYHRFGDRRGLLIAAQDHFLNRFESDLFAPEARVWDAPDLETLLPTLVDAILSVYTKYRRILYAFVVQSHDDTAMRERGAQTKQLTARVAMDQLVGRFGCTPEAADTAFRILFAQANLIVLYRDEEISLAPVNPENRRHHLTTALLAVLRS